MGQNLQVQPYSYYLLRIVNEFRNRNRPVYLEVQSALKVNGKVEKGDLKHSPFLIFFEYGAGLGKEGYWTYDHMSLQFEDCADCIQALYPQFETVWMFDHSCGHDRGREDGLIAANMNTTWGGKQRKVRSSEITQEEGFLGPHSPSLKVGDIQSMVFQETDIGPYYMPEPMRSLRRYDEIVGEKQRPR